MTTPKHLNQPAPHLDEKLPDADSDLKGSLHAIRRAALRARQVAQQTGTDLIVVRSGQVVRVRPENKTIV